MKVLDRYIMRELFTPILFCTLTLVFLILIADLFDNLDDLISNKTTILIIIKYYLNLVPYAFSQVISWSTWLGTIFLLVSFGLNSETIAMKAAGLKISTIVRPILFLGFLLGIFTFLVNDQIVPKTYDQADQLLRNHIEHKKEETKEDTVMKNVTFYSGQSRLFYFRNFFPDKNEVNDVIALWLDRTERSTRQKMIADKGTWDGQQWTFYGVMEYQMDSQGRILGEPRNFSRKVYEEIKVTPQDLVQSSSESTYLTYKQIKSSVNKLQENGVNVDYERVEMHSRLAAPWKGLVMMLIAIPLLATTRNRKEIAGSVLLCVVLVFTYHVVDSIGLALGKAGKLLPFLSAWAGNIIFAIGALFVIDKANH